MTWTLVNQSSERSAIEWLCMDIDGCNIVYVYKPPTLQHTLTAISMFLYIMQVILYECLCASDFNCQHTDWAIIIPTQMKNAWLTGQSRKIFLSYVTIKMSLVSSLFAGTLEPIPT